MLRTEPGEPAAERPAFARAGRAGRLSRLVRGLAGYALPAAAILGLWQAASDAFAVPVLFPSPVATIEKAMSLVAEGRLQGDIAISLWRILCGFVVGSLLGTVVGLLMGSFRLVADLLNPFVNVLRFIGPIAWISAVMIWFGIGELSKIVLIVYTTTFVVLVNTMIGVITIHPNKLRAARCFGASPAKLFLHVTLPAALPHILAGARLAMMNSFMTVVSAEMIAAESGLGFLIFNSRQWMETDAIFVGMLTLGILGLATDRLLQFAIRTFLWRYRPED